MDKNFRHWLNSDIILALEQLHYTYVSITVLMNAYCKYIFINAHLHNNIGTTMSNIKYADTAVLASQFNANGTNLEQAKL